MIFLCFLLLPFYLNVLVPPCLTASSSLALAQQRASACWLAAGHPLLSSLSFLLDDSPPPRFCLLCVLSFPFLMQFNSTSWCFECVLWDVVEPLGSWAWGTDFWGQAFEGDRKSLILGLHSLFPGLSWNKGPLTPSLITWTPLPWWTESSETVQKQIFLPETSSCQVSHHSDVS